MSLKDLLSPELYDEVVHDAHDSGEEIVKKEGQPLKVKCPICKKETVYDASNPYRPFCSEKCRLIDLGAWANEDYKLPTQDAPQAEGDREENQF